MEGLGALCEHAHAVPLVMMLCKQVEVNDSDNIKQDLSIDVYGRKEAQDKEVRGRDACGVIRLAAA